MSESAGEPIVACPGYCCSDLKIRFGDGYLSLEKLKELAADPVETVAQFYLHRMLVPVATDVDGIDHFDCNFFDPETRRCTNYAERPRMCRNFPSERACSICTYDSRHPNVPGVLRPRFDDPEKLREFVEQRRRKAYGI